MGFLKRLFKGRKSDSHPDRLLDGHTSHDAPPSLPQGRSSLPQATSLRSASSGNGSRAADDSAEYHESISYDIPYGYDIPQPQINTQKLNEVASMYPVNPQKAISKATHANGLPPKANGREPFALYNPPTQEIHSTVVCNLGELEAQSPLIHDYQVKIRKEEVRIKQQRVFKGRYEKKNENNIENGNGNDIFNRYTPPQGIQNVDILSRPIGSNGPVIENSWNGNRTVPLSPMVRLNNSSNQTYVNKEEATSLPKLDLEVKNVYTLLKPTASPPLKQTKTSAFVIPDLQADEADSEFEVVNPVEPAWSSETNNHVSVGAAWKPGSSSNSVIPAEPPRRISILNEDVPLQTQWKSTPAPSYPVQDSHALQPSAMPVPANGLRADGGPVLSSGHAIDLSRGAFSSSMPVLNEGMTAVGAHSHSFTMGHQVPHREADQFDEIPTDIPVASSARVDQLYQPYQLEGLQEPEHTSYAPAPSNPAVPPAVPPSHPEPQFSPSHLASQQGHQLAPHGQEAHYMSSAPKSPSMSVSSLEDRAAFPGSLMAGHLARLQKKQKEWHDHFCVLICKQHDIDFAYLLELYHDRHAAERDEKVEKVHVTNATIQFVQGTVFTVKTTGELNKKGTTHFLSANSVDETKAWLGAFELVPGAHVSWVGKDGSTLS
ncbi:hypothetical protein GUITHDRAFT_102967 [Guillardia theta CCMP2712]|uniref:PH domain-containing protein n=1 Tax=Guillardia theta (strain CCMP2712) TaxID=905079 RepID=L1JRV5_GUITC|nr:hypothetical protein GUITHDRAFT_102967 [Guillardia theta CCMP2712]EKX51044.1 hypothetical protein GUITHDRAFT_102967 [Guillardia theta CCMP2712]|eukprot:XP_005838024.1 hypothetical protein GUITHDRAFT_102967 [Guillardia theta CCMP2712]